jgi:hypothetical protein
MKNKQTLWAVLEKYDGNSDFVKFCDSLSRFIQNSFNSNDIIVINQFSNKIDKEDYNKVNSTIGHIVDNFLFSI